MLKLNVLTGEGHIECDVCQQMLWPDYWLARNYTIYVCSEACEELLKLNPLPYIKDRYYSKVMRVTQANSPRHYGSHGKYHCKEIVI